MSFEGRDFGLVGHLFAPRGVLAPTCRRDHTSAEEKRAAETGNRSPQAVIV